MLLIKEYPGILASEDIQRLFKCRVKAISDLSEYKAGDYLIYSNKDTFELDKEQYSGTAIEDIYKALNDDFFRNFDKYYLLGALNAAKQPGVNTLITGPCYAQFGVDDTNIPNAVNCALLSQDIYYDSLIIKDVIKHNSNIKTIVWGISYLFLYLDLSSCKALGEVYRISNVYYPVFGDMHHAVRDNVMADSVSLYPDDAINNEGLIERFAVASFSKNYFSKYRSRKESALRMWTDPAKGWNELSDCEKDEAAKKRMGTHNKFLRLIISQMRDMMQNKYQEKL